MRNKLRWLTIVAGVSLLSMVGLQLFWLRVTYKEQERTFIADADNALFNTVLTEGINKLADQDTLLGKLFSKLPLAGILSGIDKQTGGSIVSGHTGKMSMSISIPDTMMTDSVELNELLQQIKARNESSGSILKLTDSIKEEELFDMFDNMSILKKAYAKSMAAKGYQTQMELALLDSNGVIVEATCDTTLFKAITVKTSTDWMKNDDGSKEQMIQFAFPGVSVMLLQRMGTILTISSLLIIFCLSSSTYLLILFFRQKRISEMKNDFMNNMTHELKTPISSVSVAIELMNDAGARGAPDVMKDYMQIAQGELNRLTMLVEKVLKIAAFEKSDINIRKENFLAVSWLQQVSNSFKPIFETGGVVCGIQVRPELLMLHADKTHLTNVVHNLIDNAIKYNDKPRLMLELIIQETGQEIYLMVKDNGMGISAADQQKVFDKFYRVPHGNLHEVKGYGLGLSYVKEIVRLHEGKIRIESVPGQGSTFIITLPKQ